MVFSLGDSSFEPRPAWESLLRSQLTVLERKLDSLTALVEKLHPGPVGSIAGPSSEGRRASESLRLRSESLCTPVADVIWAETRSAAKRPTDKRSVAYKVVDESDEKKNFSRPATAGTASCGVVDRDSVISSSRLSALSLTPHLESGPPEPPVVPAMTGTGSNGLGCSPKSRTGGWVAAVSAETEHPLKPVESNGESSMPSRSQIPKQGTQKSLGSSRVQGKLQKGKRIFGTKRKERVWRLLDDPSSGGPARLFARYVTTFTVFSVLVCLLQSVESPPLTGITDAVIEVCFEVAFIVEFLVRAAVTPNKWRFVAGFHNFVDFAVGVPLVVRAWYGFQIDRDRQADAWFFLVCVVPVLRLLKVLRHFDTFKLVVSAFIVAMEALPALLFTLAVLTLSFAATIYAVEPRDNIPTLSKALWMVIVTTTTVGYGDTLPQSTAGTFVVSVLIICSGLYFAIPLGMVGHAFTGVWSDRDKILLINTARGRLREWGYEASDISELFRHFDSDGSGQLDLAEFRKMVQHMGLRLSTERCLLLFEIFDDDKSGVIDDVEFIRHMYPDAFQEMQRRRASKRMSHWSVASSVSRF